MSEVLPQPTSVQVEESQSEDIIDIRDSVVGGMSRERTEGTGYTSDRDSIDLVDTDIEIDVSDGRAKRSGESYDEFLHRVLGVDYEYAKDSGLLDIFYHDPETGEEALEHILIGTEIVHESGAREVAGFHHELSSIRSDTYVDHEKMQAVRSNKRSEFKRLPYNPYNVIPVVRGFEKSVVTTDKTTSEKKIQRSKSSMFPREYDALAVMQAVRIARETRDASNDTQSESGYIIADGLAPMLDGQSNMTIRLVMEPATHKIVTAFPLHHKQKVVSMSPEEVRGYLGLA